MNIIKEIFLTEAVKKVSKNKSKEELQNYVLDLFSKSKSYLKSEYGTINNFALDCYKFSTNNINNEENLHITSNLLTIISKDVKIDFNTFVEDLKKEEDKEKNKYLKYLLHVLISEFDGDSIKKEIREYVLYHVSALTELMTVLKSMNIKDDDIIEFSNNYVGLLLKYAKFE